MFAGFKPARLQSNFADAYAQQAALEQAQKQQENRIRAQNLLGAGMLYSGVMGAAGLSPISDALRKYFGPDSGGPIPPPVTPVEASQMGFTYGLDPALAADIGTVAPAVDAGVLSQPGLSPEAVIAGTEGLGFAGGYVPPPGSLEGTQAMIDALALEGAGTAGAGTAGAGTVGAGTAGAGIGTGVGTLGALGTAAPWLGAAMLLYSLLR